MVERNYGILASLDWNSNRWQNKPYPEDIATSNFGYVVEHGISFTSLNFGHTIYPTDKQGYYYGLLPQLWSKQLDKENSRYVEIAFMKSKNWRDKQNYIVGFYAFPIFHKCVRQSPLVACPEDFELNVKALLKDIHQVKNYINLGSHPDAKRFLPPGKEMGHQGFNYLTKANVYSILDAMTRLNPNDAILSGIKRRLIAEIEKIK